MSVVIRTLYTRTYLVDVHCLWDAISSRHANRCEAPATIEREEDGVLLASLHADPDGYRWDVTDEGEAVFAEAL